MKKTLLLALAVCIMAVMVPAVCFAESEEPAAPAEVVLAEEGSVEEEHAPEQEYFNYESKMSLQEGEPGWQQNPETLNWRYWDGTKFLTGKQKIGGVFYSFDGNGYLQTGWVQLPDGTVNYYDPTPGTPGGAGSTYGVMVTGWLKLKKDKYYLNTTTGARYVGKHKIDSNTYFFASNGKMATGWQKDGDYKCYYDPKTGKMKTGRLKLNKDKYYLDLNNGRMKPGWATIKDDKYYFNPSNGKMKTGWLTLNGNKYRLDPKSGKMETGFRKIDKKQYYFNSKGVMQTGLETIKGYKYYFNSKGVMQTGAIKISGALYYFYSSGKAVKNTGWFKGSDKKQRYSIGGGKIANDTRKIGNITYVFDSKTGVLLRSMDTYDSRIQSKSSKTKYFIQVIKGTHQVRVYTGKKKAWNKAYTFTCSIGDTANPTPEGTFKINKKIQKHESTNVSNVKVRCWGMCRFYRDNEGKDYSINSILYRQSDGSVYDGRLGMNCTTGTVRLSYNNAMWIYYNAPINTTVYVAK